MSTRLTDEMVAAALGDLDQADLPPATIAALRLADLLTGDTPVVDESFQTMLREHYTDGQILELGSALAVASGWQQFIEAFGIRPDSPWVTEFGGR
ncbi:MAG: hypothetical protein AAF531_11380 [Actinomycetota bacterium]